MPLFTRRFIKDILLIIIFGTSLYTLTHNPITHPTPTATKGLWNIQLMQYPIIFGIAGHNYLTLRNENNIVVKELHGLATDTITGMWKYVGTKTSDRLKVWEFDGPSDYLTQKSYSGTELYQGEKQEVLSVWKKAAHCKEEINKKNFPYPPYGINIQGDTENSNSVAYTLTLCMELDAKHLGLITPGWGKNLLDSH